METRVDKYNESSKMSRVAKNEELYKSINSDELDNFSLRSNATVIGNQEQEIDIEKIKKILDNRYNDAPKRRSIRVEPREEMSRVIEEPTKEYDLNLVLEKAKDEKTETYEENRAKKLRNTQFDILSTLNIPETDEEEENPKTPEEDLMNLINTITINESKKKEEDNDDSSDPFSILPDLKGDDNTQVYESMSTEIVKSVEIREKEEAEKTEISKGDTKELPIIKENNQTKVDNSFYTQDLFKNKDFENEDDFVEDDKMNLWIKVLIGLIIAVFAIGLFIFLKSFLNF